MDLTIIDPQSGQFSRTTIDAVKRSGPIAVDFQGEHYEGQWTAIRDPGLVSSSFGYNFAQGQVPIGGTGTAPVYTQGFMSQSQALRPDSGFAAANLTSGGGKTLRCELRFNSAGYNISGLGVCRDQSGRAYDVQAATR